MIYDPPVTSGPRATDAQPLSAPGRAPWAACVVAALLTIVGAGCRRTFELVRKPQPPVVECAANGASCATGPACCSGLCGEGVCKPAGACAPEGATCTTGDDCCSFLCSEDAQGVPVCRAAAGCSSPGIACARAGACCSLGCDIATGTCASSGGPNCTLSGASCADGRQCCNGLCKDGKCGPVPGCRAAGEECTRAEECCGGSCGSTPGADGGAMRCTLIQQCRVAGETCNRPGDCCSGLCTATSEGAFVCKALPMCRVAHERCAMDGECCSGVCLVDDAGVRRCEPTGGCSASGERCASAVDCCSGACTVGPEGVARCAAKKCRETGDTCGVGKAGECCAGGPMGCRAATPPTMRCLSGDKGVACLPSGAACAAPEQCCVGRCLPAGDGAFSCRELCAPIGARCSATADCCAGRCDGAPGTSVCLLPGETSPPAAACTKAGEPCDPTNPRCCGGTLCSQLVSGGTWCAPIID